MASEGTIEKGIAIVKVGKVCRRTAEQCISWYSLYYMGVVSSAAVEGNADPELSNWQVVKKKLIFKYMTPDSPFTYLSVDKG